MNYASNDDFVQYQQSPEDLRAFLDQEKSLLASRPYLETVYTHEKDGVGAGAGAGAGATAGLTFSSHFECGNLLRADRLHFPGSRVGDPVHYALWMKPDPVEAAESRTSDECAPPPTTQWFYFHIDGLKPGEQYRFHIVNFCKSRSLLAEGMRPVVCKDCSGDASQEEKTLWYRTGDHTAYRPSVELGIFPEEEFLGLYCYSFTLSSSIKTGDKLFVALSQPYSYTHLQSTLDALRSAHVRRECLCLTAEGRHVDILIATENGDELQDVSDSLPDHDIWSKLPEGEGDKREEGGPAGSEKPVATLRRQFKPVLFICARAAAGDAPSSFVADGIISWLASHDAAAGSLRRHFVVIIVPMINPDGVAAGHARSDASGREFSRAWSSPSKEAEPSIFHTKRLLRRLLNQGRLAAVVEVAAHSRKPGSFFYGIQVQEPAHGHKVPVKPVVILTKRHVTGSNPPQSLPVPQSLAPLPAAIPACMQWDFLLAFMHRAPFMMDHRSCSFEAADLLCPPPAKKAKCSGTEVSAAAALPPPSLSMRQALYRYESCPPLVFTFHASFFKGSKGAQRRRHLHPGDYRNTGHALLLALAQSLKVNVHRNTRDSYVSLNLHASVGGSQAAHFAMDREFAVLERALCIGAGSMRGRHSSQNIARAVQLPGNDATRVDDDACADLGAWEAQQEAVRALLLAAGWIDLPVQMQQAAGILQASPPSSDDEVDDEVDDEEVAGEEDDEGAGDGPQRLFCHQCKVFDHEYGKSCPRYKPPPPPKKRIDEEYYVTDAFYQSVVRRYLKPSATDSTHEALRKWGTGKPYMPNYATTKRPTPIARKREYVPAGPSLSKLMVDNERKWLATHAPLPDHSGISNSRRFAEQVRLVASAHDAFLSNTSKVSGPVMAREPPHSLSLPSPAPTSNPNPFRAGAAVAAPTTSQLEQRAIPACVANVFQQMLPRDPPPSTKSRPRPALGGDCIPAALVRNAAALKEHLMPGKVARIRVPNSPRPTAR